MRARCCVLILLACAAGAFGQRRFNWQNYCFGHPAAPFCPGHDYALKPQKGKPGQKNASQADGGPNLPERPPAPVRIIVGGVDWRFADPEADAVLGFNAREISKSYFARDLIGDIAARQRLNDADLKRVLTALEGFDQVALSIKGDEIVAMIAGAVKDLDTKSLPEGLKAIPIGGSALAFGRTHAVEEAAARINRNDPVTELAQLGGELQDGSDFWAIGPARFLGPQAVKDGVNRFSLFVSLRGRIQNSTMFEFAAVPAPLLVRSWQTTLGAATASGNLVYFETSMEAAEARQKFAQILTGPVGDSLGALLDAARALPVRQTTTPKQARPVIVGLDGGPREVN